MITPEVLLELKQNAYYNWEKRGRPQNDSWTDWFYAKEDKKILTFLDKWPTDPNGDLVSNLTGLVFHQFIQDGKYAIHFKWNAAKEQAVILFLDHEYELQRMLPTQLGSKNRFTTIIIPYVKKDSFLGMTAWSRTNPRSPWESSRQESDNPDIIGPASVYRWEDSTGTDYDDSQVWIYHESAVWGIHNEGRQSGSWYDLNTGEYRYDPGYPPYAEIFFGTRDEADQRAGYLAGQAKNGASRVDRDYEWASGLVVVPGLIHS